MRKTLTLVALATACVAGAAVPARAQNFLDGSEAISPGDLRFTATPTEMFGRNGRPDRFGAALRLGYGVDEAFGVEGKAALFDGTSLLGGDADLRLLRGDTNLSVRLGGHEAVINGGPDTTALDLAGTLGRRVSRQVVVYGGASYSYEFTHERLAPNFSRFYVVPGVQWQVAPNVALMVEGGVGLNSTSPHYLGGGFAFQIPVSGAGQAGQH